MTTRYQWKHGAMYWGWVSFLTPVLLYVILGTPLTYVLFWSVISGGTTENIIAILIVAGTLQNLGFFMVVTTFLIRRHIGPVLTGNRGWESIAHEYNRTVKPLLLVAYLWNLIGFSTAGLWMNWHIFLITLSLGIPIMIQVFLSSDLSRYIKGQQGIEDSQT